MRIESFLRQSPVFQASRIARRMEASLNLILREEELTFFESLILAAIFFEKKGGIKPSDLAETFQTTRGNVSHCISSLEAKGLVRRRIDPDDARAFQLVLQAAGRKTGCAGCRDPRPDAVALRRGYWSRRSWRRCWARCALWRSCAPVWRNRPGGEGMGIAGLEWNQHLKGHHSRMILTKMPSGRGVLPRMWTTPSLVKPRSMVSALA